MSAQMSRKEQKLRILLDVHNAQQLLFNAVSTVGGTEAYKQCPSCVKFTIGPTQYIINNEFTSLFLFERAIRRYFGGYHGPMNDGVVKKVRGRGRYFGDEAGYLFDARMMRR